MANKDLIQGIKAKRTESFTFTIALLAFQIFMVVLYAVWVRYSNDDDRKNDPENPSSLENPVQEDVDNVYGYFRDINIMIFFGFGFLMTFLRRYGYSALGYTFVISAMVCQWSILLYGFFETVHHADKNDEYFSSNFQFTLYSMLNGLFCAGAVMISYGAILGRVTPTQMLALGIIEPMFYFLNLFIGDMVLKAVDVGGGMYIHTFGCYFGLTVAWFLTNRKTKECPDNTASYNGDLFAMAGTLFLWMMWPSFNAAIAPEGDPQFRALANTFISLTSSTMATFIVSRLLGHYGYKLDMVHVQNSSLAGGVIQGVLAHMNISPAIAITMGFIAGTISVLGYVFLTPLLQKRLNIQDTCGIHNLHGMPGFLGSIAAIIACARGINNKYLYGDDYDAIFRAGDDQARANAAATFISVGLAIVGGLITGFILKLIGRIGQLKTEEYYQDSAFWHVPSDYPKDIESGTAPVGDEENGAVELDIKKADLNELKKKGSSRAYRREIIRLLETLVLSEGLARKYDSSESDQDSDGSDSDDDESNSRKNRRGHHHSKRSHHKNNNNNNRKDEVIPEKKEQEIKIPDSSN
ncbi:Rh-like protein/ammonium transporter [Cavenderia fasciculata]|uniref:Rh-like protein/ammonium transporter n=1 Tax=Cavenderia fasciculata TaxID=261658 RepID=F4PWL8_CACFS|nr:Rh-like protein/ammonium transporter [Cavenderia fasciculata]EGG20382.1 Rh-like protein/ammonium transporter [Cavenderia fasciculata]|eukprot:XP_004367365.1 Rh-like protein/ammonium transporter [Cavenderia fasciculata]